MKDYGIEVKLKENFSIIRESLDRIGIINREKKVLNPSCYLLHKRGSYYIIHFKKLLALDGKKTDISLNDEIRELSIARLLQKWGLVEMIDEFEDESIFIHVLPYSQKNEYEIKHKYSIGFKK